MSMLRSMSSAIAGMKAEQTALDVVANNIANVSTTAFKASTVNFSDTLYQSMTTPSAPGINLGGTNAKTVGLGSQVSGIDKLMTNGNSSTTGRTLDVDIDGNGYLVVAKGAVNSTIGINTDGSISSSSSSSSAPAVDETLYTRNGNLSLDQSGHLVTSDGHRVMGYYTTNEKVTETNGNVTVTGASDPNSATPLTYGDSQLSPLVIPDSVTPGSTSVKISTVAIGQDGVITASLADGTKYILGQIAMASFKNPEGLNDIGNSYQTVSANSGSATIRTSANPGSGFTDNSGSFGKMQSGYLEASNVDLTKEFTDMISATRAFQAASKMISNGDEILQTITGLVR